MHLLVVPLARDVVNKAAKVLLYRSMPSCHNYHVVSQVLVISLDQSILAANTN